MGYICKKTRGSCHHCRHFRFDDDYNDFACFGKYDLTSAQGLLIWLREYENIKLDLDQARFINNFFEGHGYQLIRTEGYPNFLFRKNIEDSSQGIEKYTYVDILNFLDDNISTFEKDKQEDLWKEFESLPNPFTR